MPITIGVLALQGDVREHVRALSRCGAQTRSIRTLDGLDGLDGLVIPGGESTVMGKLSVTFGMRDRLVELTHSGLPVYGSCAGMIMLADHVRDAKEGQPFFGGLDIAVRRNAFGRQIASFETDLAIEAIGAPEFPAVFIRAPWVEAAGDAVEIIASAPDGSAADRIVAVRQGPLLATAFHPELTGDDRIHGFFADIVRGQA